MLFINQNDYPHIPYPTDLSNPESENATVGTVKSSGCGLCSACMVVDLLTLDKLELEDCLNMAVESKANMDPGTDMLILGPIFAEKYGLTMTTSNSIQDVIDCVQNGGAVIANPGGDQKEEGYIGVFTHGGHYIVIAEYNKDTEEFLILDPSYSKTKFHEEGREGTVREESPLVYCSGPLLTKECSNRDPGFYLFTRNTDKAAK